MSNSTHNFKHSALVVALVLSLMAGVAVAKGPGQRGGNKHHHPIERMIEKLDLSDEQMVQVDALMDARTAKRQSKAEAKAQIRALIDQGLTDQAAEQAANQAREKVYEGVEFKAALEQILTAEQLAKMEQQKLRKKQRHDRRRQKAQSDS